MAYGTTSELPPAFVELRTTWSSLFCRAPWTPYPSPPRVSHPHPCLRLSITLLPIYTKELWNPDLVMGAAVNQNAVSKVMLCFTLASHKSHGARHLSGCRAETHNAAPLTQTLRPPQQMEGLTRQLSVVEWGHFILLFFGFVFVEENNWKWKHCQSDTRENFATVNKILRRVFGKTGYVCLLFTRNHETPAQVGFMTLTGLSKPQRGC